MFYKINEYIYLKKDKYTFKKEIILDNGRKVYCLTAVNGDDVHGLLQSFEFISKDAADEAINAYLESKRRLVNFEYANAKPIIKITKYQIGK